ncbi:MAG: bifunctional diguanylate cyclase/phosphodiesterase [Burkholderiales bacterium]|nr:bifunctional diguanylate cyclase/phosphodiesterase [Burkholderiales bacterium]
MSLVPRNLEALRQQVLLRFAALLEGQTHTRLATSNMGDLVQNVNSEIGENLQASIRQLESSSLSEAEKNGIGGRLQNEIARSCRLNASLSILLKNRDQQWHESSEHLKRIMLDFKDTVETLAGTLIEKDLFERQSHVLENIILSYEKVSQWKTFVQQILVDFHDIFPFNFFFIAFKENNSLLLYVYYLGDYSDEIKSQVRMNLTREMVGQLNLPQDAFMDIEEFQIPVSAGCETLGDIKMITVSVPEMDTLKLAGLLGIAFGSIKHLVPQEESVIRSILAVMVMVVGSSKALNRTMSELEYYSSHDPLTGLYNRHYFTDMLDYEIGRSERHNHEFIVLMLDLDDFKDVNDTYGHPCGDGVLKGVAETVRSAMRKGDLATRIGGDEFAIILTETGKEGGIAVAEKLRTQLRDTIFEDTNGAHFHITTSIGIVTYPQDAQNASDLMAVVDLGLYRAKAMGKDSIGQMEALEQEIQANRSNRINAEILRNSLKKDHITPFFQPIFDCRTGKIFAHETLARLCEPGEAAVSAGMFIETIEKYGLGRELDRVIIRKSLSLLKEKMALKQGVPRLFINLSAQEIQGRGVLGFAEQFCSDLDIPPRSLVFEILERDAIGDMTNMRKFLTELRKKGFSFALDDFGSGYNSFHYLRELQFDFVKMDGEFVRNILHSKIDYTLVRNLSRLCQDLGILVVAEYVESKEILQALQDMGVEYAQGYYLGAPMPEMQLGNP